MPKKVKRGIGMMKRTQLQYDLTTASGEAEWQCSIDHGMKSFMGFDEKRDEIATNFRAILKNAGVSDPFAVVFPRESSPRYSEDSLEYLIASWLIEYHHLNNERDAISSSPTSRTLEYLIERSVELGKIQERLVWRQGHDEVTGKRREILALAGQRQVRNGQQGNEMRTDNSFYVKHGVEAQGYVDDLSKRNLHLSWSDIQKRAAKHFGVSVATIKRNLTNPKKAGSSRSE